MSVSRSQSYFLRSFNQPKSFSPMLDGRKPIDWPRWLRLMERKRRLVSRSNEKQLTISLGARGVSGFSRTKAQPLPAPFFLLGTLASFRLEGLDVTESTVIAATQPSPFRGGDRNRFRSRCAQRVRSHVAILHHIERSLRRGELLKTAAVVRWYTQVSSGLSITSLDEPTMTRLDQLVRRINSPHLRLQPAVQEIVRLHSESLADPIVPGFNGILARLLLRYHLGRCGLPPVVFDADSDGDVLVDDQKLLGRMLELIDESYNLILSDTGVPASNSAD